LYLNSLSAAQIFFKKICLANFTQEFSLA